MADQEFQAFVTSLSDRRLAPVPAASVFDRVTVLGGGLDARLLAVLCLADGADVTLFSTYGAELAALRDAGGVTLRGAGPSGTYAVDRGQGPSIRLSGELDEAVSEAELLWLTGPVMKQRAYAMVLAEQLTDGQVLAIVPGRTLGALEIAWYLRIGGCRADVTLVEIQALPFWIRTRGPALYLTRTAPAPVATLPEGRDDVVRGLARFLPDLTSVQSVVHSSFADGSGLAEVPALLLGGPAVTPDGTGLPVGAEPLPERDTFRALIGERHHAVTMAMADERRHVATRWGIWKLSDVDAWLDLHAGALAGDSARSVPTRNEATQLVQCAVIGSLAPLLSAAEVAGVAVPVTRAVTTLAEQVLGGEMASAGRSLDTIGFGAAGLDDARRTIEAVARGDR